MKRQIQPVVFPLILNCLVSVVVLEKRASSHFSTLQVPEVEMCSNSGAGDPSPAGQLEETRLMLHGTRARRQKRAVHLEITAVL